MHRVGFYSGSFDPVTNGHLDIIESATSLCDELIVAVGVNPDKVPWLSAEKRIDLLRSILADLSIVSSCRSKVSAFSGLVVDAARAAGATLILRGLRDVGDFDSEARMAAMNAAMAPEIKTVFLMASPRVRHISATLVRQIADLGGDVSSFVPDAVARALATRSPSKRSHDFL
ncbi:MAG TPA: pantetheine-phosphate adenylyltransferase [Methylocella sp.]|nr:pantetheine-phosphate adenylyltransferase [Methylocella sp.]